MLSGTDSDVAALALGRLGDDVAVVEDHKLRINRDVAAVTGFGVDRGGNLAVRQIEKID